MRLRWFFRRLASFPAWMILSAEDSAIESGPPQRFRRAWLGMMLVGGLWGVALCCTWGLASKVFGDFEDLPIMPAMAALTMTALIPGRRAIIALSEIGAKASSTQSLLRSLMLVVFALCLVVLRTSPHYLEYPLPYWIDWIRPPWKPFRVLMLMPLWGAWAMLINARFHKPMPDAQKAIAAFAEGCGPLCAAASLVPPLAGSLFYFHYLGVWRQMSIAFWPTAAAIGGGWIVCRGRGLGRTSLLAVNLLTQFVFLLAYLANR